MQHAARQEGSLARRSYPEVHEEGDELPTLPSSDFGLIELETEARRAERELEDARAVHLITSFLITIIAVILIALAIVKLATSSRVTNGRPHELSAVAVEVNYS